MSNAGVYLVTFTQVAGSGPLTVQLEVNGTAVGPTPGSFSRIVNLAAGDVITFVNSGGSAGTESAGTGVTIVRIA